jgi:hypothetical protein
MNKVRKGKRFEYFVRDYFRRRGYKCFQLSASKPFDLIAFAGEYEYPFAIECKCGHNKIKAVKQLEKATSGLFINRILAYKTKFGVEFYDCTFDNIELVQIPNLRIRKLNAGETRTIESTDGPADNNQSESEGHIQSIECTD